MSDIVLSASVRQNLLSLQSTASLLATTQNDLATGNKVNSALDNPTNYFTSQNLNSRASDIGNLLDSIGNGVQVLQSANTGITSLQSLISNAKSVANQVLQTSVGYDTLSSVTSAAITGATAQDLLGSATGGTAGSVAAGAFTTLNVSNSSPTAAVADTGSGFSDLDVSSGVVEFNLDVDGVVASGTSNIELAAIAVTDFTAAGGTLSSGDSASQLNATDVAKIINWEFTGSTAGTGPVTVNGSGQLSIASSTTGTDSIVSITGYSSTAAGGSTGLGNYTSTGTDGDAQNFTIAVDGGAAQNISLTAANVAAYNTAKSASLNAASLSATDVANLINYQYDQDTGGSLSVASVVGGKLVFTSGTTGSSSSVAVSAVTGTATSGSTGITAATGTGTAATGGLSGETLTIGATVTGGTATNITFGTGTGQISTLNALNTALSANDLQASISSAGAITITTNNNAASKTIGTISGTAESTSGAAFNGVSVVAPVADATSQTTRASLVAQYNNILSQINSTAQDSSFNGINLLNGDTLKLTFDETGKSSLSITGVTFNDTGLGLATLASGTDFLDNNSANTVLSNLNAASSTLSSEASTLGSNLSIVQIRQDFNKSLIDVLQTGASNLTLADTNQLAADSQALSTRQSIAVSALSLANQSQQSVLQLLR